MSGNLRVTGKESIGRSVSGPPGVLGFRDVADASEPPPDHWYWCRLHQEAEPSNQSAGRAQRSPHPPHSPRWVYCVRIGPFMSEREANRLLYKAVDDLDGRGEYEARVPLGMEIEADSS